VAELPKIKSETKNVFVYVRVTNAIKDLITYQAAREGVTPSEWVRNLIIKELREREALQPPLFRVPGTEEKRATL